MTKEDLNILIDNLTEVMLRGSYPTLSYDYSTADTMAKSLILKYPEEEHKISKICEEALRQALEIYNKAKEI